MIEVAGLDVAGDASATPHRKIDRRRRKENNGAPTSSNLSTEKPDARSRQVLISTLGESKETSTAVNQRVKAAEEAAVEPGATRAQRERERDSRMVYLEVIPTHSLLRTSKFE